MKLELEDIKNIFSIAQSAVIIIIGVVVFYNTGLRPFQEVREGLWTPHKINLFGIKYQRLRPQIEERAAPIGLDSPSSPPDSSEPNGQAPPRDRPRLPIVTDSRELTSRTEYFSSGREVVPIQAQEVVMKSEAVARLIEAGRPVADITYVDAGRSAWSYLGHVQDGRWGDPTFDLVKAGEAERQSGIAFGDGAILKAHTDTFRRDSAPILRLGWTMGAEVGVVKEGGLIRVEEIALVPAARGGHFAWARHVPVAPEL